MARYSLFVLKVLLNNKPSDRPTCPAQQHTQ